MGGSYWIIKTEHGPFLTNIKDFIGKKIYENQVWEPEIIEVYKSLLQPHYIIVDVGAHMGFHTINFANNSKHVYAFEPQPHLYNQVCGNIFLNELDSKITCFNIGLGETNKRSSFGSLDKHNSLNWDGNWDVELINYGGRSLEDDLGTDEIEIRTLDSFNLNPHLIKIDVEGYELKTLQGSIQTLKSHHPVIIFECFESQQKEVFQLLDDIGYEIFSIPNTSQNVDFLAIHPQFDDYNNIKNKFKING